jgi:hypothetical protein
MTRLTVFFALYLVTASFSWGQAPLPAPKITGIYSSLTYNAEGGDLLGMELLVIPAESAHAESFNAVVQIAEGGAPFCAVVPVTIRGSAIAFTLPAGGMYSGMHFTGTISGTEAKISWPSGQVEHLRRGASYWQGS